MRLQPFGRFMNSASSSVSNVWQLLHQNSLLTPISPSERQESLVPGKRLGHPEPVAAREPLGVAPADEAPPEARALVRAGEPEARHEHDRHETAAPTRARRPGTRLADADDALARGRGAERVAPRASAPGGSGRG